MRRYGFSFDVEKCSGCMACVIACQDQNDVSAAGAVAFRHVAKHEESEYPGARISFLSLSCQQCGDAPCVSVCPSGALARREEDGVVLVDSNLCVGCHSCELACPFGAPRFPEDGKMAKCDLCLVRRDHGLKPACVRVCPTGALKAGPMDELAEKKADRAAIVILKGIARASSKDG